MLPTWGVVGGGDGDSAVGDIDGVRVQLSLSHSVDNSSSTPNSKNSRVERQQMWLQITWCSHCVCLMVTVWWLHV